MTESSSPKSEANELEHLRDILYGERVRSIETRLDEIEQRITRNSSELNRRVDHEVEELTKRIDSMGKRFDERVLAVQTQQAANMDSTNKRLDAQSASQTNALNETRAALQAEIASLTAEIRAWRERIGQMVVMLGNAWTDSDRTE